MQHLALVPVWHGSAAGSRSARLTGIAVNVRGDGAGNGPATSQKGAVILLVEDDLMIGQMYVLGLKSAGYEVTLATDGRQALEKMRSRRPDLVLLDIRLPQMDGLEVLAAVREDHALRSTKIVILSNFGEQETIREARSLGAVEYLNKSSVTPGELARRLPEWLGKVS